MDGLDPSRASELAQSFRTLKLEQQRLEQLRSAYRIVERSKFARLRAAFAEFGAALGVPSKRTMLFTPVRGSRIADASNDSGNVASEIDDRLRELEIDRLNLLEQIAIEKARSTSGDSYEGWWRRNMVRPSDTPRMRELARFLPKRPLISIVVATYETPETFLREAIESVRNQIYSHWQLCIADDASQSPRVREVLEEYTRLDSRIRVVFRPENGHISEASNSALELAEGDFVGFLDHDDLLSPDALLEIAFAINQNPTVDMLYSDEDKIDPSGKHRDPHFKPDWCPESYLSRNYTCHFGVYRRSLVEKVGGLRAGFEGSQDYDLVLRVSELTDRIVHVPKILYHWRMHSGSTSTLTEAKPYAYDAAARAITEALERRGEAGRVVTSIDPPGIYIVRYDIREQKRVSVIIPTRDHGEDVDRCLNSLFAHTKYPDLEVIVLDNGSTDRASLATFRRWKKADSRVNVIRYDVPFNYSRINNYAVSQSTGEYLLFLNNDIEIISSEWIEAMVEQAQRPPIGAVGALLLFPDNTVQHAGVIIGIGGVAGHSHKYYPADASGHNNVLKAVNNYSAVTGACLMVRRAVFDEVGGLDETLAVAFNDVDLCLKMGQKGYRNVYLPHVIAYHFESKSRGSEDTPERQRRFQDEAETMMRRWNTMTYSDPCYNPNLSRDYEDFRVRGEHERWVGVVETPAKELAAAR